MDVLVHRTASARPQPAYELRLRLETVQDATSDTGRPDEHGQISCISMGHCKRERMLVVGLLVVPHIGITEGVGFGRRSPKVGVKANRAREATVLFCDRHVFGQAIGEDEASSRKLLAGTHAHRVRRCDVLTKRLQTYRIVPFQAQITNPIRPVLQRVISSDQYAINHGTRGHGRSRRGEAAPRLRT